MHKWLLIQLIGLGLMFGGCSLAPEYAKPQAPVPQNWPQGEAYKTTSDDPQLPLASALKWDQYFTDQKLQKVITLALGNNRDLRLAALNVEKTRALYGIQRAELLPTADLGGRAPQARTAEDLTQPGNARTSEQYHVNLGIASWEIDFFGRIRNLKDRALEEYLATEQARRSAQIMLIAEISRVYLSLAADRENLKLAQSTLTAQQASYDLIKKSVENGFSTEIDLHRAQTQVDAAKRDVPRYRQLVAQDINALNLLAGMAVPDELLPDDLSNVSPPREITAGLPSEILLSRPDVMAAEHRLKGANAYIGAARAAFFPRISLTAAFGTASNELSGLFNPGSYTWNFTPLVSMPIFDARTWFALEASKADQQIILVQYEKAIQTAFREVADALAVNGTIMQQVSAQKSLVKAAEATYQLSNKRYLSGFDSYLSVLDAHRALYLQQQVLITLRLSALANQVKLYAALGGGAG